MARRVQVKRKSESRQTYYNIISGVTIAILVAAILGAWGWVVKLQVTVNKADLALREIERNTKEIEKNNKILHSRITSNQEEIKEVTALTTRSDERSKLIWTYIMRTVK